MWLGTRYQTLVIESREVLVGLVWICWILIGMWDKVGVFGPGYLAENFGVFPRGSVQSPHIKSWLTILLQRFRSDSLVANEYQT